MLLVGGDELSMGIARYACIRFDHSVLYFLEWLGNRIYLTLFCLGNNIIHLKSDNIGKLIIFMLHGCFIDFIAAR
jgi:hypothetical protein